MSAQLSVVITSVNGLADLQGCLKALDTESKSAALEIIVVERCGRAVREYVRKAYPSARLLEVDSSVTIPEMRARAFDVASSPAVAVIEDHVIVPEGWATRLLEALGNGDRVVGGSVHNAATETLLDWAAFLCEYSHCLPPMQSGPVEWLTGNNVVYPKRILDQYRSVTHEGRWENYLHDRLRRDGVPLVCHPEIVVGHKKHYSFGEYLSQRYLYARSYAGARVAGASPLIKAGYGVAAFALPPLLFYRTVSRILNKGRHRGLVVKSAPMIAIFVLAWSWGEVVGSWAGAGNSLSKVC